jgi:hypothetical protein
MITMDDIRPLISKTQQKLAPVVSTVDAALLRYKFTTTLRDMLVANYKVHVAPRVEKYTKALPAAEKAAAPAFTPLVEDSAATPSLPALESTERVGKMKSKKGKKVVSKEMEEFEDAAPAPEEDLAGPPQAEDTLTL